MSQSWLPHGGATYILEVRGHLYSNFYGVGYALLTGKDAIVFFTQREGWSTYLHLVPLHDGKEITIKLDEDAAVAGFGWSSDDIASSYIEKIEDDHIYFVSKAGSGWIGRYTCNLKTFEFKFSGEIKGEPPKPTDQAKAVPIMAQKKPAESIKH